MRRKRFLARFQGEIRPTTLLKTRGAELVAQVSTSRRPVGLTQNGEARARVLDMEGCETLRDATSILQPAFQSPAAIQAGAVVPQRKVFSRVPSRLARR